MYRANEPVYKAEHTAASRAAGPARMGFLACGVAGLLTSIPKLLAMILEGAAVAAVKAELIRTMGIKLVIPLLEASGEFLFSFLARMIGPVWAKCSEHFIAISVVTYVQAFMAGLKPIFPELKIMGAALLKDMSAFLGKCLAGAFAANPLDPAKRATYAVSEFCGKMVKKVWRVCGQALTVVITFVEKALPVALTLTGMAMVAFGSSSALPVIVLSYAGAAAGTGTAISALSGAAAESAALAWLGGGTLAAGGGGVAAGALVLEAVATGGAILAVVGGLWMAHSMYKFLTAPETAYEALEQGNMVTQAEGSLAELSFVVSDSNPDDDDIVS